MNIIYVIYYTNSNCVLFPVALDLTLNVSCQQFYSVNMFSIQNTPQGRHLIVTLHTLLLFILNIMISICKHVSILYITTMI